MKILKLEIRNFGKLADREISLSDGINLIYGENESGKSTIHTFIRGMLFGIERGKGRASAHDVYSRFEPWENPNYYSGRLKFESGGKNFWLDRNFDKYSKKAELICEDDGEELSVNDGDLQMILGQFSESVYDNTVSVGQLKSEPGQPLAAELRNYAANYYASGDGDLNLDGALNQLKERKKDIEREMRESFRRKQLKREKIEQEASFLWRDVHRLQGEQDNLEEQIAYRMEHRKENKEIENNRVIDEIRPGKWRVHPVEIIFFIAVIVFVFFVIHKPWNYLVAIVLTLLCLIYTWNRMKVSKKQEKTEPEKILEEITSEEEKIPLEKLIWEKERGAEELLEKQTQYNNLREQLEEMHEMGEEYWDNETKKEAVDFAINKITELSKKFQMQMKEELNSHASEIISNLTGGKYTNLVIEDNLKMSLLYEGKKIPIEQLSRGTAEQLYLALRMASAEILGDEKYPIILDDTFAYYDDMRLAGTLKWLAKADRQILLFTCQKREEETLRDLGIPYTKHVL
ncbi:MAG: ATP-binding protein [Lachnospiraceae bacterium]